LKQINFAKVGAGYTGSFGKVSSRNDSHQLRVVLFCGKGNKLTNG